MAYRTTLVETSEEVMKKMMMMMTIIMNKLRKMTDFRHGTDAIKAMVDFKFDAHSKSS